MRFFYFSSYWFNIVFSWKNNFHIWKISFEVKIYFSYFFLLRYLGNLPRDLAPRAFLKKFSFRPFWPKTVKNWPFWPKMPKNGGFSHFFGNPFIRICYFFVLSLVFGVGKNDVFVFFGKIQKWPFLAKFGSFLI